MVRCGRILESIAVSLSEILNILGLLPFSAEFIVTVNAWSFRSIARALVNLER